MICIFDNESLKTAKTLCLLKYLSLINVFNLILNTTKRMKKIATALFLTIYSFSNAQTPLPPTNKGHHTSSAGLKISSRKSTLIEKEIINLAKFKNLNIQKIVLKDLADNSTETVL